MPTEGLFHDTTKMCTQNGQRFQEPWQNPRTVCPQRRTTVTSGCDGRWSVETQEPPAASEHLQAHRSDGLFPRDLDLPACIPAESRGRRGPGGPGVPWGGWPSWKHQRIRGAPPLLQVPTPGGHTLPSPEGTGPGHRLLPAGTLTSSAGSTPACPGAECRTHSWSQAGVRWKLLTRASRLRRLHHVVPGTLGPRSWPLR